MLKIGHLKETEGLHLPEKVIADIKEMAAILDIEYGENREVDTEDGGYILVIEEEKDFTVLNEVYIDINNLNPEYVDEIKTDEKEESWLKTLILCSSDFAIILIMPQSVAPKYLIDIMRGR